MGWAIHQYSFLIIVFLVIKIMNDLTPNPSPERRGGYILEISGLLSPLPPGEGLGGEGKNKIIFALI
ncbi:MAG TPA: hypothetical protein PK850_12245 [Ignavibacteria bacterium]|nr:hypothetical protein [Ignavibacteria bacterium]